MEVKGQTKVSPWVELFDDKPARKFEDLWPEIRKNHPELPGLKEIEVVRSTPAGGGTKHILRVSSHCFIELEDIEMKGIKLRSVCLWTHKWRLTMSKPQWCANVKLSIRPWNATACNCHKQCTNGVSEMRNGTQNKRAQVRRRVLHCNCGGKGHFPSDRWCPEYQRVLEAEIRRYDMDSFSRELTKRSTPLIGGRQDLRPRSEQNAAGSRMDPPPNSPRSLQRAAVRTPTTPRSEARVPTERVAASPKVTARKEVPPTASPAMSPKTVKTKKTTKAQAVIRTAESDNDHEEEDDEGSNAPKRPERELPARRARGGNRAG